MDWTTGNRVNADSGGFCCDALWDTESLLNSSWPTFTDCFQHTVLVYGPTSLLWIPLPVYIYTLSHSKAGSLPLSTLSAGKIIFSGLLVFLSLALITHMALSASSQERRVCPAEFTSYAIRTASHGATVCLAVYERYRHVTSSGLSFLFWFASLLCDIVPVFTMFMLKTYETSPLQFYLFLAIYLLEFGMLILHCPADTVGVTKYQKKTSPEVKASFISRILFLWIWRTMYRGWRRELIEDDFFHPHPRDCSDTLISPFEHTWQEEVLRVTRNRTETVDNQSASLEHSLETTPLLTGINASREEQIGDELPCRGEHPKKKMQPSLLRVLFKLKGKDLVKGFFLKVMSDVFLLSSPMILSLLIDYADDRKDERTWQGHTLAFLLFVLLLFKAVLFDNSFSWGELIGMQLKTTLLSAIYKKALRMNNQARQEYTAGKIVNLMAVDCTRIQDVMRLFFFAWVTPLQTIAVTAILYQYIGWSVLAGLATLLLAILLNMGVANKLQTLQRESMGLKDQRLRLMNDVLAGIKVVKLYAWEPAFQDRINAIRQRETDVLLKISFFTAFIGTVFSLTPFLVSLATFAVYVKSSEENFLDAKKTFLTLTYFGILKIPLVILSTVASTTVQALVSIDRINKFLCTQDLDPNSMIRKPDANFAIQVENGCFSWDSRRPPTLKDITLKIPERSLTAVVGTVGSGKSSLMSAFLGEMDKLSGHVCLKGSVAYAQQSAWIPNATIRENILFGKTFNERKYQKVVSACALVPDLDILSAGDLTEIGEKGINLSGGQKQRVSLARAMYHDVDLYILDDPLSAVDSHVGKHIFDHVISEQGLLKNKTRILVTNDLQWLPHVDHVLFLEGGQIAQSGSYETMTSSDGPFARFLRSCHYWHGEGQGENQDRSKAPSRNSPISSDPDNLSRETPTIDDDKMHLPSCRYRRSPRSCSVNSQGSATGPERLLAQVGKLVTDEQMERGKVKMSVYSTYAKAAGVLAILVAFLLFTSFNVVSAAANFWLSAWTQDATLRNATLRSSQSFRDTQNYYLAVYGAFGVVQTIVLTVSMFLYWLRMVGASKRLHLAMIKAIFRCPMAFFDTTPLGRILNRFSRDIEVVDSLLPLYVMDVAVCIGVLLTILVVITINTPLFLTIIIPFLLLYLLAQTLYIPSSRQAKRLEAVTSSPIYSHFSETLSGVSTIRAYQKLDKFFQDFKTRVDRNGSFYFLSLSVNRAVSLYLDALSNVVVLASALFAVLTPGISGAVVGLSVSYAMQSSSNMVILVRTMSDVETNVISVERLKEYIGLKPEADWILPANRPPKEWPVDGNVEIRDYETRYRDGLDLVLKGITCSFKCGEKIAIVGRTGAGKSSLALALFRLIEASKGSILVDRVRISEIGVHDARSRFTILPQDPVLFSGSLRMNLDPLGQYGDDQLWQTLATAHLRDFVRSLPGTLDHQVGEEGQSLSVGQRQLICLARALLRKSKILVLDEATAAVDIETDRIIQETIRTEFDQCTIITIAHRLNIVMDYDRIMVLDGGRIRELDTPTNLLANSDSAFYAMAKDANLV